MIVVDSSVWIAHLRNIDSRPVHLLRMIDEPLDIIVGDLVLLEILQGARDDQHAAAIERSLRQFRIAPMLDPELATEAARNYRILRSRGAIVRKTIDMIIGTFCMRAGYALLHDDRDFEPMVEHLGLRVI